MRLIKRYLVNVCVVVPRYRHLLFQLAQGAVIVTVYVFGVPFSAVTTMGIEVVAA